MLQYTPLTANMSEGANATAALTQLLMLQLLHQHQPNANQQDETFDQRQCWREILEEMHQKEQQCKMDVNLRKLAMMNKHHYDSRTVLPPCLRQLVIEDELLNILKRRYLSAAGIEAAKSGNTTELKMLLDGGLLTDVTDSDGATMLHHAAKGNQFGVVSLLLKSGANPSPVAFGWNGQTPLNNAAYRGYLQVIKLLVRFKANLDAQTKSGNTPLHDSAFNGYLTCFKFLIMSGANPSLTNSDGKTPRDVAVERGQFKIVQWLDSHDLPWSLVAAAYQNSGQEAVLCHGVIRSKKGVFSPDGDQNATSISVFCGEVQEGDRYEVEQDCGGTETRLVKLTLRRQIISGRPVSPASASTY